MRKWRIAALALGATLAAGPAEAQDAETLRRELDQMRKQFEDMKREYQKAIDQMSERLNRIESESKSRPATESASKPQPATGQPEPTPTAQVPPPATPGQIGRASCRERAESPEVAGSCK